MQIPKPISLRYNPYTQSIETISDHNQIHHIVRDLKSDINILEDALKKLNETKLN